MRLEIVNEKLTSIKTIHINNLRFYRVEIQGHQVIALLAK
jgi:hypothetical protein